MITIFRHALARSWGQILVWGLCLALLGMFLVPFYDTMASQKEQLIGLLQSYPPELMSFFYPRGDASTMFTPEGYLTIEFFSYMPLIVGIYAILVGSGLLAGDEENGTLDLVLAHPVSRAALFFGRLLAFAVATAVILFIVWLGFVIIMNWSTLKVDWGKMALPFLSLLAAMLFFGTLALLLSMVLPSRRAAAMVAGILLVASFFITSLARVDKNLETVARFSPLNYYQSGEAVKGLNGEWFWGLLVCAALLTVLAWWRFGRRDIRVGGEGSWRWSWLPSPARLRQSKAS
jgi:ABC-2 type transport system permease protein